MFLHTRILNENKLNHVMKMVNKTKMSKYWFMENHFIPAFFNKTSVDLSSFMNNLQKSFDRLVESATPDGEFAARHRELMGGEVAEKEVIDAVKKYLAGTETFMSNVHLPDITMGKSALLRKLSKDVMDFVSNYKFRHPAEKNQTFFDEKKEKEHVNKMLGKRIAIILGVDGNVFDDISAPELDKKRMKQIYPGLIALDGGIFTAEQESIMNIHGFDKQRIKMLAKKILDVIHRRKGEQAGEKNAQREYMPRTNKLTRKIEKGEEDNSGEDEGNTNSGEVSSSGSKFNTNNDTGDDPSNQPPPPPSGAALGIIDPEQADRMARLMQRGTVSEFGGGGTDEDEEDEHMPLTRPQITRPLDNSPPLKRKEGLFN